MSDTAGGIHFEEYHPLVENSYSDKRMVYIAGITIGFFLYQLIHR